MTSAHLWRSACDIQSGTSSSSTPARRRAETVRRRFRVATMRMGGGNAFAGLFKCVVLRCCEDGVFEGDSRRAGDGLEPRLLSAFSDAHP
jgi:hypothetical protein